MNFEIITDSSANLPDEVIREAGIRIASLTFLVDGVEYRSYDEGVKSDLGRFYEMMRNGKVIQTSLVNTGQFVQIMEPLLKEGKDILYIGFSSALSGTYQSAVTAAELLKEDYPERRIVTVDSLSASLGQGLLVWSAAQKRKAGSSLEETAEWVKENRLRMRHHFTVDDLMFLKRGGRISATSAMLGTMLNIKPTLKMDDEGRLAVIGKVRGRRHSLKGLVDELREHAVDIEDQTIAISHGDCLDEARYVEEQIRSFCQPRDILINIIDPVIGAHSGPGTMALFFLGQHR
jgi:EDD domain protein, DegV family